MVRGAGSVRFGPQNVGGIINFATRAIPQEFAGNVSLTTEYASGTDQVKYSPNLFVGGTLDNGLGLALLYSGTKGDGYREANNKTDIDDVMLKTAYQITDADAIALNLHHYEGYGEMPEGLTAKTLISQISHVIISLVAAQMCHSAIHIKMKKTTLNC